MPTPHWIATSVPVLLATLVLAACGGGEESDAPARDRNAEAERAERAERAEAEAPEPGSPEAGRARTGGGAYSLSPAVAACMEQAGFAQDAPPTGGLVAWRHGATGGRAVVASGEDVTTGIAAEIGTTHEARVEGTTVVAAPEAQAKAALDCLA